MKTRYLAAALLLAPLPASAAPSGVNADAFYTTAVALQGKGVGAMFDKRVKPMIAQMKDAGTRARALNQAATQAGKPLYCVPATAKGLSTPQVIAMLGRMPASERRTLTLAEAWKHILVREYPCG